MPGERAARATARDHVHLAATPAHSHLARPTAEARPAHAAPDADAAASSASPPTERRSLRQRAPLTVKILANRHTSWEGHVQPHTPASRRCLGWGASSSTHDTRRAGASPSNAVGSRIPLRTRLGTGPFLPLPRPLPPWPRMPGWRLPRPLLRPRILHTVPVLRRQRASGRRALAGRRCAAVH
jgi:hypothetical protein